MVGNLEGEGFADGGRRDRVWPAAMGGSDTLGSDSRTVDGATRGCRDGHMRVVGAGKLRHHQIRKWSANVKEWSALRHSIKTLNADETSFLKRQVEKNQTTTQLHPFNAGGIPNFVRLSGMYQGLQNKGIVSVAAADPEGKIQTITIEKAAWRKLKRKFR
ncbi:MAG TPA: hypothetical protein VKE70_22950 [Candidatus Solibacter sp.]|nr:hypothetical protein [Candidatus Solibacter sp.]